MATQPAPMPIEQYLSTSYSPDVDFVDGHIEERSLGEYEHGRLQGILFAYFHGFEKDLRIRPVVEQRVLVDEHRVRICDLAVVRSDIPREKVTRTPPLVCIEILSPEDRLARAKAVLSDYLAMGVEHIWLFDPQRATAYSFDKLGLYEREFELTIAGTDIRVDVQACFAAID